MARREFGLHKVGKYWHADFWVGPQHIHRSTKHTVFEDAKDRAEQWRTEAQRKADGLPVDSSITCQDLWELWLEWAKVNHSEAHWKRVKSDWDHYILPAVGARQAKTLRDGDAEEMRTPFLGSPSRRNHHYGKETGAKRTEEGANKVMRHLRLVFHWGVYPGGKLAQVPFRVRIEEPDEKPKSTLSRGQLEEFLAAVDRGTSLHMKVMVRLMLFLGLREKEARDLRWTYFESPALERVWPVGKGGKARPMPVLPQLKEWLLKVWPEDAKQLPDALVVGRADGLPHVKRYTTKAIERGARAVKLEGKLTPHRMRATFGTLLVREGKAQAHLVKQGMRHDLLQTSEDYVQLETADLQQAMVQAFGETSQKSHKITKKSAVKILIKRCWIK